MISPKNYFDTVKNLDFSTLPEALQKGHIMAQKAAGSGDWAFYHKSDAVKKTLDLYFEKIASVVKATDAPAGGSQRKPKAKKAAPAKAKAPKETAIKAPKAAKLKKDKAVRTPVPSFSAAQKVLRSFLAMDGRKRSFRQIQLMHQAISKAILDQRIKKSDPLSDLVKNVADKIAKLYKKMAADDIEAIDQITIQDRSLIEDIKQAVGGLQISFSVSLLKRFINLQGTVPAEAKVDALVKQIESALKRATGTDKYSDALGDALKDLKSWKSNKVRIKIEEARLSGLQGLAGISGTQGLGCADDPDCGCNVKTNLAGTPKTKTARGAGAKKYVRR